VYRKEEAGPSEIGKRLRHLRLAFGYTSVVEWSRFTGIGDTVWFNYENGRRVISIPVALKLAGKTGASFDWIYRGLEHTLPEHLLERLQAVPPEVLSPKRQARREA
jgi:transcriptional regulator with XRE-family HTH domain